MVAETDPIVLKLKPALWRIKVVDSLFNPKMVRHLTVKGAASVRGAIDTAMHGEGFKDFREQFAECAITGVEFIGVLDN